MKFAKALIIGAVLSAGAAFAEEERTDPNAIARAELMQTIGKNIGIIGDMAGGKTAFDAAAAEAAKKTLVDGAAMIAAKFEKNAEDPGTEAKPDVWANWDAFIAKANGLGTAAAALDVTSAETIGAGMAGVGGACKDCHTTFRM